MEKPKKLRSRSLMSFIEFHAPRGRNKLKDRQKIHSIKKKGWGGEGKKKREKDANRNM